MHLNPYILKQCFICIDLAWNVQLLPSQVWDCSSQVVNRVIYVQASY